MTAQSKIVYADLWADLPQLPSVVAGAITRAAKDSLTSGQYDVALQPLSVHDVRQAMREYPSDHERLSLDRNLVLLDAGAMLAYAPYRARIVLTGDPFEHADRASDTLQIDIDALRVRLHDALLSAHEVVVLGQKAFDAVVPFLSRHPRAMIFPATALRVDEAATAPILVVNNEDERSMMLVHAVIAEMFPAERFLVFDPVDVFDKAWKAALHIGVSQSSLPGARLSDAWAGNVPVLQLVNAIALGAQRRRHPDQLSSTVVEHGRTGLLVQTLDELVAALGDLLLDALPARAVARGAKRRVDPAADWDAILKIILQ